MSAKTKHDTSLVGKMVLGRYRILGHLADGGMGSIYLARSEGAAGFMRAVVVKALLPSLVGDDQMVDLFMREARIMSNLRHPGIVGVIDFAQEGPMLLMVLEYVHGFNLGRWHTFMRKTGRQFPADLACYIVQNVLRALHAAHTLKDTAGKPFGIVHRDVTPSNVLIDVDGHVKLADFGIARATGDHTQSQAKTIKGKLPYLAPELFDTGEPGPPTDIYSVGVTLHELLAGKNEFFASDAKNVMARVMHHEATAIDVLRPDAPPGLAAVVARALSKDVGIRYATAAEFAEALSRVRTLPEEELASKLAESASADFLDPRMAEVLRLPQLQELEAAWRTPVSERIVLDSIAKAAEVGTEVSVSGLVAPDTRVVLGTPSSHDEQVGVDVTNAQTPSAQLRRTPTDHGLHAPEPPAAALAPVPAPLPAPPMPAPLAKAGRPWLPIGVGAALLAVGAVVLLTRTQDPPSRETAYIVTETQGADDPPPVTPPTQPRVEPIALPPPDAGSAAQPERKPPDVRRDPPQRGPESVTSRLAHTFGQQKAKITACFRQNAVEVSGAPELSIRIEIATDGHVSSAELSPAELATTELGKCILAVARATRFDPQPEPVAFRVPIKAKVN